MIVMSQMAGGVIPRAKMLRGAQRGCRDIHFLLLSTTVRHETLLGRGPSPSSIR